MSPARGTVHLQWDPGTVPTRLVRIQYGYLLAVIDIHTPAIDDNITCS